MGKTYDQLREIEKVRTGNGSTEPAKAEKPVEKVAAVPRPSVSRAPMAFFVAGVLIVLAANIALLLVMKNVASEVRYAIDRVSSMEGDVDDAIAQAESAKTSVEELKKEIELLKESGPGEGIKNDIESLNISRDEIRGRLNALEKAVEGLKSASAPQQ